VVICLGRGADLHMDKRAVKRVCVCDQLKKIPMQMFIMERYKHAYTVYQYLLAF